MREERPRHAVQGRPRTPWLHVKAEPTCRVKILQAAQDAVGDVLHMVSQQIKVGRDDAREVAVLPGGRCGAEDAAL